MAMRGWIFSSYGVRTLWAAGVVLYLVLGAWSVLHGHAFNGVDFGTGLGAVFAAGGWGVKQHDQTKPAA